MADQRIQSTEEMVGAGHATKADTLNRRSDVEHENDGKHTKTTLVQQGSDPTTAVDEGVLYTKDDGSGNNELYFRGESAGTPLKITKTKGTALDVTAGLPKGYRQGWKMSNNATDAVNDLDIAAGKGRNNDDDGDVETTAVAAIQMDATGAGGRQSAAAIPNGTWFDIYMIAGSGQTTKGFAVRESLSVSLPSGYTDYARVGYWYWVDGTVGLIPAVHEENGNVWFKDNHIEDHDSTGSATSWTNITISVHADLVLPLLLLLCTRVGASSAERNVYFRPDGSSWAGQSGASSNDDPIEALGLAPGGAPNSQTLDQAYWGPFPAPGGIIEWMTHHSSVIRTRVYVAGFFNGHHIK